MLRLFLLLCVLAPSWAFAVCTNPAGDAGHIIFNTTAKTMQYCNGTNWVNTGASNPTATQSGCVSPTAVAGTVHYASATGVIQFCNGQNWVDTACAAQRKPNGPGCSGQPAGTLQYSNTANELQFCDSTNWVAMGWGCSHDLSDPVWNSPTTLSYTTMEGQPFSLTPSVTDDQPGLVYSVQGTLPTGLSFNTSTGAVSGTPSALGTYTFTIRATDTSSNYVERTFTMDVTPAEVVAYITSSMNNVSIQSLFSGTDWADSARTKRVVINSGVTVGSTNPANAALLTGTGRGSNLVIQNSGTIAGAGGAANGGAGGAAINSQQTGVTITNAGNIYGGGGGGGTGGTGGGSNESLGTREPASGYTYNYSMDGSAGPNYQWVDNPNDGNYRYIAWNNAVIVTGFTTGTTQYDVGGYRYFRGVNQVGYIWSLARQQIIATASAGGVGGNGGRGQGSDGAATAGLTGVAGGTNAGTGGTGGTGGTYGTAGATGSTGTAGNAGAGTAGSAGGAAGRAVTGSGYTVTNTGSILGAY